jgi:hypothetical protein
MGRGVDGVGTGVGGAAIDADVDPGERAVLAVLGCPARRVLLQHLRADDDHGPNVRRGIDDPAPTTGPTRGSGVEPPKLSLTPGWWKFGAVTFALINFLDNLGEATSPWRWALAALSALTFAVLFATGHCPSPPKRRKGHIPGAADATEEGQS